MPTKTPPTEPPRTPDLRVKYFPTTSAVTQEIETWAKEKGARIRAIVPVYWESMQDG